MLPLYHQICKAEVYRIKTLVYCGLQDRIKMVKKGSSPSSVPLQFHLLFLTNPWDPFFYRFFFSFEWQTFLYGPCLPIPPEFLLLGKTRFYLTQREKGEFFGFRKRDWGSLSRTTSTFQWIGQKSEKLPIPLDQDWPEFNPKSLEKSCLRCFQSQTRDWDQKSNPKKWFKPKLLPYAVNKREKRESWKKAPPPGVQSITVDN